MTLTIELPPDVENKVRQQAEKYGQDITTFVLQAVNERLTKTRSFDEVCAPITQAVAASGINDEEFDSFFEEVRDEVWHEKHGKTP